jgi:hypothetical protein
MGIPTMDIWVLTFLLTFPDSFIGDEYQSKIRCEQAAMHQFQHWKIIYGPQIRYKCEMQKISAEGD